jgi:hypothetical protein
MADFRKCIPVLAILALILGLTTTASAQSPIGLTCVANSAVPQQLRFEGLTELVGDIVIQCTGGVPTPPNVFIPQVNITVFMGNTTVTSRIISTSTTPYTSEALLMLDEPTPGGVTNQNAQTLCGAVAGCTGYGNGQGGFKAPVNGVQQLDPLYYGPATGVTDFTHHPNMFQGLYQGGQPNAVTWIGIPVDPPGTNGTRVIRITNIRINANALGVGTATSPPVQAQAFISATPSTSLPISNNASQVVGYVQRGLTFDLTTGPTAYAQCNGAYTCDTDAKISGLSTAATLRYRENFASAFKRRNIAPYAGIDASPTPIYQDTPGVLYGTETGFYAAQTGAVAGLADFGTRIKAVFNNVPLGAKLYVDNANIGYVATNAARLTSSEAGAFSPVGTVGVRQLVTLTTVGTVQTGQAVWEVLGESQQGFSDMRFGVYVCYVANPGANSPGLGTSTVNGSFAPISTVTTASTSSVAIPRFADTSTAVNIFSLNVCATNLLFPFVTNQLGYDTGLAIANTSADPFGTTPQTGVCTLYSYGDNAAANIVTPSVAGGTVWTGLASAAMPNFQGYVIARCTFQYAHGFAFISDLGARNLAMGYLALVIPDPARTPADSSIIGGVNAGEQLGQ